MPKKRNKSTTTDEFGYVEIEDIFQDPLTQSILEASRISPKKALTQAMEERNFSKLIPRQQREPIDEFNYQQSLKKQYLYKGKLTKKRRDDKFKDNKSAAKLDASTRTRTRANGIKRVKSIKKTRKRY